MTLGGKDRRTAHWHTLRPGISLPSLCLRPDHTPSANHRGRLHLVLGLKCVSAPGVPLCVLHGSLGGVASCPAGSLPFTGFHQPLESLVPAVRPSHSALLQVPLDMRPCLPQWAARDSTPGPGSPRLAPHIYPPAIGWAGPLGAPTTLEGRADLTGGKGRRG